MVKVEEGYGNVYAELEKKTVNSGRFLEKLQTTKKTNHKCLILTIVRINIKNILLIILL